MIRALNYNAVVINNESFIRRVVTRLWRRNPRVKIAFGDMDDALQAARVELVRAAKDYGDAGPANWETFASVYIRRGLLNASRSARKAVTNARMDLLADENEVTDKVQQALLRLSQEDQELLAKRFGFGGQDETPASDLAELLGVAPRTAQLRVSEALDRLKAILEGA